MWYLQVFVRELEPPRLQQSGYWLDTSPQRIRQGQDSPTQVKEKKRQFAKVKMVPYTGECVFQVMVPGAWCCFPNT